nr:DUF4148 domain-containing protein [uncultured Roseateles sp.]
MFRTLTPFALAAAAALTVTAAPASADNGFTQGNSESGGAYHVMPSAKTRAQVLAELAQARADGSLAKINSEAGYAPEFEADSGSSRAKAPSSVGAGQSARLEFDAPAAGGGRTRAEVIEELKRAREDGTLAKINSEAGYAPEFEPAPARRLAPSKDMKTSATGEQSSALKFEAPAAGGRTRAEVLEELRLARQDGSLRRMNTNRGY